MTSATISYLDVPTKQVIDNWGDKNGFDAAERIKQRMEDRFSVSWVHIVEARDEGAFLALRMTTDRWSEPREYALLDNGSLAW